MLTGDILTRSAERFPQKTAVICGAERISYAALNAAANRFAHALQHSGVQPGEHIAMICRNRLEYAIVFFGSAKAGTVLVNISVQYTPEQFVYALEQADVTMLLVEEPFLQATVGAHAKMKEVVVLGIDGEAGSGASSFAEFMARANSETEPQVPIAEDDPFCMTFTGGTTGMPKGVLASHRNRLTTAHTVVVEEGLDESDVVAIVTPLFHVAALNIMFQPAMLVGATCVFQSKWGVSEFVQNVQKHGITAGFMVPTQLQMLVSDQHVDARALHGLQKISFAGAPMPDWVQAELLSKFPALRLVQIYGQSEVGVVCALPHRYLPEKLGSIGRQSFNVGLALLDPAGHRVARGEIGELCSRGDNVMLGYYNNPAETAKFFRNGWGWTGDLARMDEDGCITLVDRSKDMLISGGENIYPKEIENALLLHEGVGEAAVIGVPDEKWGEVPVAYVIPRGTATLLAADLIRHCESHLSRFKVPHAVFIVDSLPLTSMGKVQKHELRARYREQFGGMTPLLAGQQSAEGHGRGWGEDG